MIIHFFTAHRPTRFYSCTNSFTTAHFVFNCTLRFNRPIMTSLDTKNNLHNAARN